MTSTTDRMKIAARAALKACFGLVLMLALRQVHADAPAAEWLATSRPPPGRVEIRYEVRWKGVPGAEGSYVLEHGNNRYSITANAQGVGAFGLFDQLRIHQSSEGEITPKGLVPKVFRNQRGSDASRLETATFDWGAKLVSFAREGDSSQASLPAGTLDQAALLFQFAFATSRGAEFSLPLASGHDINVYEISVLGDEQIELPSGSVKTRHVRRQKGNRQLDVWLSLSAHLLPVRIRFDEGNGVTEFLSTTLTTGKAISP